MKRDTALLALGAEAVSKDLARSFGDGWVCDLVAADTIPVSDGAGVDVAWVVQTEFDPEDALPPGALEAPGLDNELAADAVSAVTDAVQRAIEPVVGLWPWCAAHARPLWACGSTWVFPVHMDVAEVGQLPPTEPWTGGGVLPR